MKYFEIEDPYRLVGDELKKWAGQLDGVWNRLRLVSIQRCSVLLRRKMSMDLK